ncbi:MAG: rhodanese-related sulfurtransferase [Candidatus Paceibacteria bacterium]|jgi:rhodanese-related sulfurtransferase
MPTISAALLRERLQADQELSLVNVLPKQTFDRRRIAGSQHASQYEEDFLERIEFIVEHEQACVVVYCNSKGCNAASKAAEKLALAGYTNVLELDGGLAAWESLSFPVQGSAV